MLSESVCVCILTWLDITTECNLTEVSSIHVDFLFFLEKMVFISLFKSFKMVTKYYKVKYVEVIIIIEEYLL